MVPALCLQITMDLDIGHRKEINLSESQTRELTMSSTNYLLHFTTNFLLTHFLILIFSFLSWKGDD